MKKGYTHISLLIDSSGSMEVVRDATIANYNKFLEEQRAVKGEATLSHYEFSSGSKLQRKSKRLTRSLVPYLPPKFTYNQQITFNSNHIADASKYAQANAIVTIGGVANCVPNWSPPLGYPGVGLYSQPMEDTTDEFSIVEDHVDLTVAQTLNRELFVPHNWTPLLDSIGRAVFETGERLAKLPESMRPEKVLFVIITDGQENSSKEYTRDDIKNVIEHQRNKYDWDFVFLAANMDAIAVGTSYGVAAGMSANFATTGASMSGTTATLSGKVASYRMSSDISVAKSFLNYSDADRLSNFVDPTAAGVQSNTDSKITVTG